MKYKNEIRIALVFIGVLALGIWGINFMKGKNILSKERVFYSIYDRTAGLTINNPVTINGHQVGLVRSVEFMENDPRARLLVTIGVTDNIFIPADSRAIIETGLLGSNQINILLGNSSLALENHDTLASAVATTLQEQFSLEMLPIKMKAENVMLSLDTMLTVIRYVFNEETRMNLSMAMENIRRSIDNLKSTTHSIDEMVSSEKNKLAKIFSHAESITENIKNNNETLTRIINNIGSVSDSLSRINFSRTIHNADIAIANFSSILNKINDGDGSMGQLINNKSLYLQLEKSSSELKELIHDIKKNPDRYVQVSVFSRNTKKKSSDTPAEKVEDGSLEP